MKDPKTGKEIDITITRMNKYPHEWHVWAPEGNIGIINGVEGVVSTKNKYPTLYVVIIDQRYDQEVVAVNIAKAIKEAEQAYERAVQRIHDAQLSPEESVAPGAGSPQQREE